MNQNEKAEQIIREVSKAIIGKPECIRTILCAILSGGHVLIEDIPGVGKTTLALAFAAAMGLEQKRIQFTPDILPSDITGFTMYQREREKFIYQPGAVMCNLFLADEINRTSPKTQSALLEVMEENAVTVDGVTRPVPSPFVVIATENPIGYTGTQMLPESQLDRFQVCVVMGYPSHDDEIAILKKQACRSPMQSVRPVTNREELLQMQAQVRQVVVSDPIYQYIVALCSETRHHPGIELGHRESQRLCFREKLCDPEGCIRYVSLHRHSPAAPVLGGQNESLEGGGYPEADHGACGGTSAGEDEIPWLNGGNLLRLFW